MKTKMFSLLLAVVACLLAGIVSFAVAESTTSSQTAGKPEMQLPPGWTVEDMQAVMAAGTPGKMHQHLAQDVGKWQGKTTMWMFAGAEPTTGQCSFTILPLMDGRFFKTEMSGEMPGMGPFNGLGITGFDNVTQQFVSTWIDNQGTGIANGTGQLSDDGKTMTWDFTYNCPVTKKPTVLRQVETTIGPDSKVFEMFGRNPKTGDEFKMMRIEYTRQQSADE